MMSHDASVDVPPPSGVKLKVEEMRAMRDRRFRRDREL